jgi:hypothetical protein
MFMTFRRRRLIRSARLRACGAGDQDPSMKTDAGIAFHSNRELSRAIGDNSLDPLDLTRQMLSRIDAFNPTLNAYVSVYRDTA